MERATIQDVGGALLIGGVRLAPIDGHTVADGIAAIRAYADARAMRDRQAAQDIEAGKEQHEEVQS